MMALMLISFGLGLVCPSAGPFRTAGWFFIGFGVGSIIYPKLKKLLHL